LTWLIPLSVDLHGFPGKWPAAWTREFLTLLRYVEANPPRARMVARAEQWRWSSLGCDPKLAARLLDPWPVRRPRGWTALVNEALTDAQHARIKDSFERGRPLGDDPWTIKTAQRLGLQYTLFYGQFGNISESSDNPIMLSLDDPKWKSLRGGYRIPYNPAGALRRLYASENQKAAWAELWEELHHQGDVGDASYASVPHLVQIQKDRSDLSWDAYALIATIEIERHRRSNPPIPDWLLPSYESAWNDLMVVALRDYAKTTDALAARAILGVLALCKGLREIGMIVSHFDESEIKEIFDNQMGGT
jgi:hypothetical protein